MTSIDTRSSRRSRASCLGQRFMSGESRGHGTIDPEPGIAALARLHRLSSFRNCLCLFPWQSPDSSSCAVGFGERRRSRGDRSNPESADASIGGSGAHAGSSSTARTAQKDARRVRTGHNLPAEMAERQAVISPEVLETTNAPAACFCSVVRAVRIQTPPKP